MENRQHISQGGNYHFLLFISGMSAKSARAIENLRKICDSHLPGNYRLEIVDITSDREKALAYEIIGIPTLIKISPDPKRIILGDLSETEKVMRILELE